MLFKSGGLLITPETRTTKALCFLAFTLVTLFSAGVSYGWVAVLTVLKLEGVYSELCDDDEVRLQLL